MGEAGPSRLPSQKTKWSGKPKNGMHSSKSRKVSEAKAIEILEQAAQHFVRRQASSTSLGYSYVDAAMIGAITRPEGIC